MAELCLDCWNKLNETNDSSKRYVLSWEKDLCEECREYKRVIVVKDYGPVCKETCLMPFAFPEKQTTNKQKQPSSAKNCRSESSALS